jgi:hypothetical protein
VQICLLPAAVAGLQNCPTWPSIARVIKVASGAHAAAADRNLSSSSCAPSLYWFPAATNGTARHGERWIDGKRLVIARDGIDALIRSAGPGRDGRTGRRPRRDKDEGSAHHCTGIGSVFARRTGRADSPRHGSVSHNRARANSSALWLWEDDDDVRIPAMTTAHCSSDQS